MNPLKDVFFAPLHFQCEPELQEIQIGVSFQLPHFQIIGLPAPEVEESRDRIRLALRAIEVEFPKGRVTINLSPASIRKTGTGLDLAIALTLLQWIHHQRGKKAFSGLKRGAWGEISLDGSIQSSKKLTRTLYAAWKHQLHDLFLSASDREEVQHILCTLISSQAFSHPLPQIFFLSHLKEMWDYIQKPDCPPLNKTLPQSPPQKPQYSLSSSSPPSLYPLTRGLEKLLGVLTSGFHHCLLLGPRGLGKSRFLDWIPAVFPNLSWQDWLQQRFLEELNQSHTASKWTASRENSVPLRIVGPNVRPQALIGQLNAKGVFPGEFSLAQGGVLLADELLEWSRDSLETLREPLENRRITLNRVHGSVQLPAQFLLAATSNLCPCGGWPAHWENAPSPEDLCQCSEGKKKHYASKLSSPLLDRIDLLWQMRPLPLQGSTPHPEVHASFVWTLKEKIHSIRAQFQAHYGKPPGLLSGPELEKILNSFPDWKCFLKTSENSFLSLRARHQIGRLGLTLAGWYGSQTPKQSHWQEAQFYRPQNPWSMR